jgi:A/G-specific adenine glycosylase
MRQHFSNGASPHPVTLLDERVRRFRRIVFRWWAKNRRDLPWRRTHDPYRILVSEIMLQQTQLTRVIPKYRAFLKRFPTLTALAAAERAEVLRLWSGLGYNRRAVNLHRAAKELSERFGGLFDGFRENPLALRKLPGVGEYTARAIAAFAWNVPVVPLDTNIRRVLIRHFGRATPKNLQAFADATVPKGRASDWAQALMDFGSIVCTAKNPRCAELGLSHIAEAPRPRPQGPFRNSDRFFRGRIVDVLRRHERPVPLSVLMRHLPQGLGSRRLKRLVARLAHDGIITKTSRGSLSLAR